MSLETGNYINDLVITNPTSSDPKSAGDDHLRLIKTALKECFAGFTGAVVITATDTGTAAAHVLAPSTALVGYTTGLMLLYRPITTGTGALTVNVSGLGVKSVKTILGADPTAGDIVANQPVLLMYDGTNFVTLAGSAYMSKTGNQTVTGNLTLTGSLAQTGNHTLTGNQSTSGTMGVGGNTTVGGTLGVTGNTTIGGTLAVTSTITSPSLNLKADLASPALTGTPTAPTATAGTNTTQIATTAHVATSYAPLASPALTGVPTAPTATAGTNTTQIATMAALATAAFSAVLPGQTGNADKVVTTDGTNASWSSSLKASVIRMVDGTDTTKKLAFGLSGITTATTRTMTVPNADFTVATLAANTFTGAQIGTVTALTSSVAAIAINLATNNNFSHTTSENTTLSAPSNPVAGQSGVITITQGATPRTLAYNTFWKFAGGTVPTLTATVGAVDIFAYNVESASRATAQLIKDVK